MNKNQFKTSMQTIKKYVDDSIAQASIGGDVDTSGFALKSELFSKDYNDLTNKPVIPSIDGLATETYVDNAVAEIIDSAPETLNTLNELAQALGDDPNFATTIVNQIGQKADKSEIFSGNYNDLSNKPAIPSIEGMASESYVNQQISNIQHPTYDDTDIKNQLANKADKTELFSKNYDDLSNKPIIPSIEGLASESYVNDAVTQLSDNLQGQIDDLFQNVSNGKELIASAITDKGVDASKDETFQSLSKKINLIPSGPPGSNIIGYINEENDIYVSLTELESGTYTLKFEDYEGLLDDFDDIGTVEVE